MHFIARRPEKSGLFVWKEGESIGIRNYLAKKVISWASENRSTGLLNSLSVGKYLPQFKDWSTKNAVNEGYEKHVIVFRCVRKIAVSMASIKWGVVGPDGDPIEDHLATDLLDQPSEKHTWNKIIQYLSGFKSLAGDAFLLYLREGEAQELLPLFPGYVSAKTDKQGNITKYEYGKGSNKREYDPEQIIHSQFISYQPGWEGMAPLKPAGRIVDIDNEAVSWHKGTLERGGRPAGMLKSKEELSKKQQKQIEKKRDEMKDPSNDEAHIPIFGANLDFVKFAQSAEEMDFSNLRDANKAEIADAYGVPIDLLNFGERAKYENQQAAVKRLWNGTIIPRANEIKDDLNLSLAPLFEGDIQLDYNLAGTEGAMAIRLARSEEAERYWNMGVPFMEVNEKLDLGFDSSKIPNSDTGFVKSTLLPSGSSGGQTATKQPETRAINLESEEQKDQYWRSIDRKKRGYEGAVSSKVGDRFAEEKEAVVEAFEKGLSIDTVIQRQREAWLTLLMSSKKAIVEQFGEDLIDQLEGERRRLGLETREIDPFPPRVKAQVEQQTGQSIEEILSTTQSDIKGVVESGRAEGLSKTAIADKIAQEYEKYRDYRASFIARTEVHSAAEMGKQSAAEQSKVVKKKKWISSRDSRVRESHRDLDGETRLMKETYSNNLQYPGDLSGPVEEVINCRCTQQFITKR